MLEYTRRAQIIPRLVMRSQAVDIMGRMKNTKLLGGLTPDQFLRRHWQKKPLLIRNAIPEMKALLSREDLFNLAVREDV